MKTLVRKRRYKRKKSASKKNNTNKKGFFVGGEDKMKNALDRVIEMFDKGEVAKAVAIVSHPKFNIPSAKWSLSNKILAYFVNGASDPRSFKAWEREGRAPKKAHHFYIFKPYTKSYWKTITDEDGNEKKIRKSVVIGFNAHPVWDVSDTEGKELDYQKLELPDFPLMEKSREWGIDVSAVGGNDCWHGAYVQRFKADGSVEEAIKMATSEEKVFFHELAHAAHKRVHENFNEEMHHIKEIVAELSAAVLSELVGVTMPNHGDSLKYIKRHAESQDKSVGMACIDVIADVEKVLKLILS